MDERKSTKIQPRDATLFRGLYESRIMTTDQIAALYFENQREMAHKRITKLKQAGYVAYRAKESAFAQSIIILGKSGFEYLVNHRLINDLPQMR